MEIDHAINQRIFETSLDLILVTTRRGQILRVSPSSQSILGYHPDEMVGHTGVEYIHPDDLDSTREEMRLARRGRLMRNFDCRYMHKDGHVVPLTWTGVWSEPEEQHFFIGRDMTDRIAAEAQLHQAQKMEAVGQLTGGIAHDFNNILAVILGNLELMERRFRADDEIRPFGEAAINAVRKGADLTKRLLAFSRRQDLQISVTNVNALTQDMDALLRRTLGETIEIETALAPDLWSTAVDSAQLESAILNLAVNARDAMPDGGKLIIETANVHLDDHYATRHGIAAGAYVKLGVTDTGTGMAPETVDHVFEPFFTTKEPGKGTGLGLAMVYGFVRQLGGHVKIYSERDRGTTINIYLPRAPGDASTHDRQVAENETHYAQSGETVLVVEDDDAVRASSLAMLEALGYAVIEAENGPAALAILESGDTCHLLFTDMVMGGGLSGPQLAARALDRRPALKLLFTSGYPRDALPELGRDAMILRKPYGLKALSQAVRDALEA